MHTINNKSQEKAAPQSEDREEAVRAGSEREKWEESQGVQRMVSTKERGHLLKIKCLWII
jgi:hypothetical protein